MNASEIVDQMFSNDSFSQWMGLERLEERSGYCRLRMTVRPEMCNGFGIAHGGITYSLADSALAFASNSQGRHALSITTSIQHLAQVQPGDVLTAEAHEEHLSRRIAQYRVTVHNGDDQLVALFQGTVYRSSREW